MSRAVIRELGVPKLLRPQTCRSSISRSASTVAQDAGLQKPKSGGGGLAGVVAVFAGVSIVGGSYYAMTREPQPRPLPPMTVQSSPSPAPAPAPAVQAASPFAPPAVSARDELVQRLQALKSELEQLRKQKRDKLIDVKKKAIKEEIQTIQSGLATLDKSAKKS